KTAVMQNALNPTCAGLTDKKWGWTIQRIRNERQNSSSISGTTNAAPSNRTITKNQSICASLSRGSKPTDSPITIQSAVRLIHAKNTATPATIAPDQVRKFVPLGHFSSLYALLKNHSKLATTEIFST